jgi:hypothetical protein
MIKAEIKYVNEDELPDMPKEIYDAMFEMSYVDMVRYFPYMEDEIGNKFYIVKIEEKEEK